MVRRLVAVLGVVAIASVGLVLAGGVAGAATFSVTNTSANAATSGSLPWAFAQATAANADSTITVDPTLSGQTVNLTDELLYAPAGATAALIVDGNGIVIHQTTAGKRVVHTQTAGALTMDAVTLTGGNTVVADPVGSAIFTEDMTNGLTLTNCTIASNTATSNTSTAASVVRAGATNVTNCTFSNNTSTATGAGVSDGILVTGTTSITNSTFDQNTVSSVDGHANGVVDAGDLNVSGSKFTANTNQATGTGDTFGLFDSGNTTVASTTISGNKNLANSGGANGVLDTNNLTMSGSTVTGNTNQSATGGANGVLDSNTTTLTATTVDSNQNLTGSGDAQAVLDTSDLSLTDTTVTNNKSHTDSGLSQGVIFPGGTNTVTTSTIAGNESSTGSGDAAGALYLPGNDTIVVTNSTISGNLASGTTSEGGAIDKVTLVAAGTGKHSGAGAAAATSVSLVYSTIVDNTAATGANLDVPTATTFGTVIALGHGGTNCASGISTTSNGSNFSDDSSCSLTGTGDTQSGGDPKLAALGDFSGPTPTRPPLFDSPLLDKADCTAAGANGIIVDQRGVSRPQGTACDIGSVEVRPASLVVDKSVTGVPTGLPVPFAGPYTFTVTCNDGTKTSVSVTAPTGGESTVATGIHFGATCTVAETPVVVAQAPVAATYTPVGVDTTGVLVGQDEQVKVSVANDYTAVFAALALRLQPKFTG